MAYENEGQLDRAMKRAIRDAGIDPGNGYRQMLRDRFSDFFRPVLAGVSDDLTWDPVSLRWR